MNESHRAIISWIRPDDGGRKKPPIGPQFTTVVHFEDDPQWLMGAWSLVLNFEKNFANGSILLAQIHFLAHDAPQQLLHHGSRFELLEGKKRVAKGIVLSQTIAVPEEITEFEAALIG